MPLRPWCRWSLGAAEAFELILQAKKRFSECESKEEYDFELQPLEGTFGRSIQICEVL